MRLWFLFQLPKQEPTGCFDWNFYSRYWNDDSTNCCKPIHHVLGPIESGAQRIAIMGIANKVAGALGSLIFGAILLKGIDEVNAQLDGVSASEKALLLNQMADSVYTPYVIMAIVLFILGLLMHKAPLPNVDATLDDNEQSSEKSQKTIFQFPHLWLGMLTFCLCGAVIAGDSIIAYGIALGISSSTAKFLPPLPSWQWLRPMHLGWC